MQVGIQMQANIVRRIVIRLLSNTDPKTIRHLLVSIIEIEGQIFELSAARRQAGRLLASTGGKECQILMLGAAHRQARATIAQ
jgi:hypothetical protein